MQNRGSLWSHLTQAERHIAEGFNHLRIQRRIVADLERGGHEKPLAMARKILHQFERIQEERLSDRDRAVDELRSRSGTCPPSARSGLPTESRSPKTGTPGCR
jgi:hypothetical protein